MRRFQMLPVAQCLPGMKEKTRATWPVWSGSAEGKVRFHPVSKKEAARLYHRALAFERQTREPGKQDGRIGRNGLAILRALLFDFYNHRTGQLDPAYATIARAACISVRSVARGLQRLKDAGVLFWQRRCRKSHDSDGRFMMEQESNAYGVRPVSHWRGYQAPPEAPPPEPGTWGDHPVAMRDALAEALAEGKDAPLLAKVRQLENDPDNPLARVLARLGRSIEAAGGSGNYRSAKPA